MRSSAALYVEHIACVVHYNIFFLTNKIISEFKDFEEYQADH